MNTINHRIVIAGFGITALGMASAWGSNKNVGRILVGGFAFTLILSVLDLFGGGISQIAGGLAFLALITMILARPDIWQNLALATGGTVITGTNVAPTNPTTKGPK